MGHKIPNTYEEATSILTQGGFVKRDLRRWGGGRESSFVYHWAKRSAMPLLILSWVICLALPFSLHPTFIVLLFALSVAVTASTFKKYLCSRIQVVTAKKLV